jgi:hypothetical protein
MKKNENEKVDDEQAKALQESALSNSKDKRDQMLFDFITKMVAGYYSLPGNYYTMKSRKREIVKGRQVAMYLIYKNAKKVTLARIGEHFAGKDHATVLHSVKTTNDHLETDKAFVKEVAELQEVVTFKRQATHEDADLMKEYYYMDFDSFTSMRLKYGRSIMMSGFSDTELEVIKKALGTVEEMRKHTKTGMYILEKREDEENDN